MRKAKDYPMPEVKTTFTFRTLGLSKLWCEILVTQLKDGQYKNGWWGSHQKDWAYYEKAVTQLGETTKLEGLPSDALKLTGFSRMLPVIGTEMVDCVKAVEPAADIETVRKYLQEISKAIRFAVPAGEQKAEAPQPACEPAKATEAEVPPPAEG